jgi:hypothetical protein
LRVVDIATSAASDCCLSASTVSFVMDAARSAALVQSIIDATAIAPAAATPTQPSANVASPVADSFVTWLKLVVTVMTLRTEETS